MKNRNTQPTYTKKSNIALYSALGILSSYGWVLVFTQDGTPDQKAFIQSMLGLYTIPVGILAALLFGMYALRAKSAVAQRVARTVRGYLLGLILLPGMLAAMLSSTATFIIGIGLGFVWLTQYLRDSTPHIETKTEKEVTPL